MNYNSKVIVEKSRLEGVVKISGAKNSSLRLLAASLLTEETVELSNFPNGLLDVKIHLDMLEVLGKKYETKNTDKYTYKYCQTESLE